MKATDQSNRLREEFIRQRFKESLPEVIDLMSRSLRSLLEMAQEHRQKVKENRYRSPRALDLAAGRIVSHVIGIDNQWRPLEEHLKKQIQHSGTRDKSTPL